MQYMSRIALSIPCPYVADTALNSLFYWRSASLPSLFISSKGVAWAAFMVQLRALSKTRGVETFEKQGFRHHTWPRELNSKIFLLNLFNIIKLREKITNWKWLNVSASSCYPTPFLSLLRQVKTKTAQNGRWFLSILDKNRGAN